MPPEPGPEAPPQPDAAPPGVDAPPEQPEVDPAADDPVRSHTIGEEPAPAGPDPRLLIEFF